MPAAGASPVSAVGASGITVTADMEEDIESWETHVRTRSGWGFKAWEPFKEISGWLQKVAGLIRVTGKVLKNILRREMVIICIYPTRRFKFYNNLEVGIA